VSRTLTAVHRYPVHSLSGFNAHLTTTIKAARLTSRILPSGECQSVDSRPCTLCYAVTLDYVNEAQLKNQALQAFWRKQVPHAPLDPLVLSPRGRSYRTVTKRRAFVSRSGVTLGLIDPAEDGRLEAFNPVRCAIEPDDHARIYSHVQDFLNHPNGLPLAEELSYVVIRGSYTEYAILFNVREITTEIVRTCNRLSKRLTRIHTNIGGLFLFEGQTKGGRISTYYLEGKSLHSQRTFRRIFGEKTLYQKILGRTFIHSPLSFSQVNQSLVGQMIACAGEMLSLQKHQTLYDLYCGYGPFSLCLAERVGLVVGVDVSAESVESAIANAKRLRILNARFIRGEITAESVNSIMKTASEADAAILDPPRGGTMGGVIESIAARRLRKTIHIFCNSDLLPSEIARWREGGYRLIRAVPFDMFPGTPEVEIMVLMEPQ
jgi:tRNA/tmRNA/rRNA uracil-C5-methylase (TrmA/RlmC/RlmD family)